MPIELTPNVIRMTAGIPTAAVGGLLGYLTAPKDHGIEGAARGAGIGYVTGTGAGVGATLGDMASNEPNNLGNMVGGGIGGGLMGLGVGKMMAGTPGWEQRKKFREELLTLLREESNNIRAELRNQNGAAEKQAISPALQQLLLAKSLSDRRLYKDKHERLKRLITKHPDDFYIDSEMDGLVGITHAPTGFRIHAPKRVLPVKLRGPINDSKTKPGRSALAASTIGSDAIDESGGGDLPSPPRAPTKPAVLTGAGLV